jgi:hypothetical protein
MHLPYLRLEPPPPRANQAKEITLEVRRKRRAWERDFRRRRRRSTLGS